MGKSDLSHSNEPFYPNVTPENFADSERFADSMNIGKLCQILTIIP